MAAAVWPGRCSTHHVGGPDITGTDADAQQVVGAMYYAMNDVENDAPDSPRDDFTPLLDRDEVLQDEREDRLGFARRTMRC